jgi:hypothetical protein
MANDQDLSAQDIKDLQEIASRLPPGHPMGPKISLLLNSQPTEFEKERQDPGIWAGIKSAFGLPQAPNPYPGLDTDAKAQAAAESGARQRADLQQRRAEGRNPVYTALATGVEATGLMDPGQMERSAALGHTGEVMGQGLGTASQVAVPYAAKELGGAIKRGVTNALTPAIPPGLSPEATTAMENPATRRAVFQVQRSLRPPGANVDFIEKTALAAPDLGAMDAATPIKGATDAQGGRIAGGILRPDQRLRFTADNIEAQQQRLWQNERAPQIDRHANIPATTRSIATAGMSPADIDSFEQQLGRRIPNTIDLQTADQMCQVAATELNKVNQMTPEGRAQQLALNPWLRNLDEVKGHLQGAIGDVLESNGEQGVRDFDRRYSSLQEVQDATRARLNSVEAARAGDDAILRGGVSGVRILDRLHIKASPGRLMQNALTGLNESGVRPQPIANQPSPMPPMTMPPVPDRNFHRGQPVQDAEYVDVPFSAYDSPKQLPGPSGQGPTFPGSVAPVGPNQPTSPPAVQDQFRSENTQTVVPPGAAVRNANYNSAAVPLRVAGALPAPPQTMPAIPVPQVGRPPSLGFPPTLPDKMGRPVLHPLLPPGIYPTRHSPRRRLLGLRIAVAPCSPRWIDLCAGRQW